MFGMSFDPWQAETVEEPILFAFMRTHTSCIYAWLGFMHTRPCCMRTHTQTLCMHAQAVHTHVDAQNHTFCLIFFFSTYFLSKMILMLLFCLLQGLPPYSIRGSASHLFARYQTLTAETKALVNAAGFELFMHLLPDGAANDILVQALTERWWDTTHTFHIVGKELIVTYDFHRMTSLRSDGPIINLESESGIQLGTYLLGHTYTTERICYFDLEKDYRPLSQMTSNDRPHGQGISTVSARGISLC